MATLKKCHLLATLILGLLVSLGCHSKKGGGPTGNNENVDFAAVYGIGGLGPHPWESAEGLYPGFDGPTTAAQTLLLWKGADLNSWHSFFLSPTDKSYPGKCGEAMRLDPVGRYVVITSCFHTNASGAIDSVQSQVIKGRAGEATIGGALYFAAPDFKTCEDQNFNEAARPQTMLYTSVVQSSAKGERQYSSLLIQFPEGIKAVLNVAPLGYDDLLNQLEGASTTVMKDTPDPTGVASTQDVPVTFGCFKTRSADSFVARLK